MVFSDLSAAVPHLCSVLIYIRQGISETQTERRMHMSTTWDTHRRSLVIFSSASLLGLLAACGSDEPQVETHHPAEVERHLLEESAAQQSTDNQDAPGQDDQPGSEEGNASARSWGTDSGPARAAQCAALIEDVFDQLAGTAVDDS